MCWFQIKRLLTDDDLHPMIRGHEITLKLARTPGLAQLLNDLQRPDVRRKMDENLESALKERKVKIPAGATVQLRELEAEGWELEVKMVEGLQAYTNGFNNETGFYRIQGPQRPPKKAKSG